MILGVASGWLFLYNVGMKKSFLIGAAIALITILLVYYLLVKPTAVDINYYKVLCMGDSLTASSYGQYPRYLRQCFRTAGLNVNVYSAARPGSTSGEYLGYLKKSNLLGKINPHFLVLMLGTNDVRIDGDNTPLHQFQENMHEIIKLLRDHKNPDDSRKIIFIITIPPIFNCDLPTFNETSKQRVSQEIVPAIKRLAQEEKINLIDVFALFENRAELLPGIHPSKEGYQAMARFIFDKIHPHIKE